MMIALQTGDLLFEVAGDTPMSEAIALSTAEREELQFDHVAMVFTDGSGNTCVIEASPKEGVRAVPLETFLDEAVKIDGKPGVVAMRLCVDFPAEKAVADATERIGQPYDWHYLPDNGMTYCSELIYDCYLYEDGSHIFEAKPMNFRDKDGNMPQFWTELYGRLGQAVPEGVEGTNPQDLSKDPKLTEICRYF